MSSCRFPRPSHLLSLSGRQTRAENRERNKQTVDGRGGEGGETGENNESVGDRERRGHIS